MNFKLKNINNHSKIYILLCINMEIGLNKIKLIKCECFIQEKNTDLWRHLLTI